MGAPADETHPISLGSKPGLLACSRARLLARSRKKKLSSFLSTSMKVITFRLPQMDVSHGQLVALAQLSPSARAWTEALRAPVLRSGSSIAPGTGSSC